MSHPRMYSEDDPYLAELREICLALPESVEVEAWGWLAGARFHGGTGGLERGRGADGELVPSGRPQSDAEAAGGARLTASRDGTTSGSGRETGGRRRRAPTSSRRQRPARRSTIGPAASMLALDTT